MANAQHIEWLLEGVEAWNRRRKENSDMSVDLVCADLGGAKLNRFNLSCANLTDADLSGANLNRVNFRDANLTRANFSNANLTGANLTRANLKQAILFDTTKESLIQYKGKFVPVKTVDDLLKNIRQISTYYRNIENAPRIYFRGESKRVWSLQPSAMRELAYTSNERDMLFDLIARRPGDFNGIVHGVGQLVLAQHHGLQTRFLDITRNPLVALFHACENEQHCRNAARLHVFVAPRHMIQPFNSDTVSVIANYARLQLRHQKALIGDHVDNSDYDTAIEQLLQMIQSEKPYFLPRIDPKDLYRVIIVEPQQSSERINKQAGAFLVSDFHERFERKEIEERNEGVPPLYAHYQLTIPSTAKRTILEELAMLDITRESLFPGLDESANAVNESYRKQSE